MNNQFNIQYLSKYEYLYFEGKISKPELDLIIESSCKYIVKDELISILKSQKPKIVDTALRLLLVCDNNVFLFDEISEYIFEIAIDGSTRIMHLAEDVLKNNLCNECYIEAFLNKNIEKYQETRDDFLFRRILDVLISCNLNELAKKIYSFLLKCQINEYMDIVKDYAFINN